MTDDEEMRRRQKRAVWRMKAKQQSTDDLAEADKLAFIEDVKRRHRWR